MNIQIMTASDIPEVTRLAEQLGYPNTPEDVTKRFAEISTNPHYALFVAKNENQILGWIQINMEAATLLVGPRAEIAALVVDQNVRSQGVGKALLKRAEDWALANKVPLIRVRSNIKREAAHRFYQREGYTLGKTSNVFNKNL